MWGYNYQNMMAGSGAFGVLGLFFWIVLFVDAILLGIWLWRQISKK